MKDITFRLNKCISILESAEERMNWGYVKDTRHTLIGLLTELAQTTISVDESGDMMIPDLPIEIRQLKAIEKIAETMANMAETMTKMEKSLDIWTWNVYK